MAEEVDEVEAKLKKAGFEKPHWVEISKAQMYMTDFPEPATSYRMVYESYQISMEETYFWILNYLGEGVGFPVVEKVTDIFAASEYSALGGVAQQRISMQQEKVSQFMHTIAKLVRELFQLVREVRILDERLAYYVDAASRSKKNFIDAQITLKGIFVDQVEGGAKSPSSVYGMSREVQFTTLPDLFFMTNVENTEQIPDAVEKLAFNRKVKEVLKRKIYAFMRWKEFTYTEQSTRRKFTLQYLRQHFDVILMYMNWIKPYLKTIKRMQTDQRKTDMPDLVGAFEGAMIETEFFGISKLEGSGKYYSVIDAHILFRVRPSLSYNQEHYQRGPIHVGRAEISLRSYAWTQKEIDAYKKYREEEAMDLLGMVDKNIEDAMKYLGNELKTYLRESGEPSHFETPNKVENPKKKPGEMGSIFSGFKELFGSLVPKNEKKPKKKSKTDAMKEKDDKDKAADNAAKMMWLIYKNFKKGHKMIAW